MFKIKDGKIVDGSGKVYTGVDAVRAKYGGGYQQGGCPRHDVYDGPCERCARCIIAFDLVVDRAGSDEFNVKDMYAEVLALVGEEDIDMLMSGIAVYTLSLFK